jgi:hypothetical protein
MGFQILKSYLYGTKFTIVTDHRPFPWVFSVKDLSSRLLRRRIKLEDYECDLVARKKLTLMNVRLDTNFLFMS